MSGKRVKARSKAASVGAVLAAAAKTERRLLRDERRAEERLTRALARLAKAEATLRRRQVRVAKAEAALLARQAARAAGPATPTDPAPVEAAADTTVSVPAPPLAAAPPATDGVTPEEAVTASPDGVEAVAVGAPPKTRRRTAPPAAADAPAI